MNQNNRYVRYLVLALIISATLISCFTYFQYYSKTPLNKQETISLKTSPTNKLIVKTNFSEAWMLFTKLLSKYPKVTKEYLLKKYGLNVPYPSRKEIEDFIERCEFDFLAGYGYSFVYDSRLGKVIGREKSGIELKPGDKIIVVIYVVTYNGTYVCTLIDEYTVMKPTDTDNYIKVAKRKPVGWLKLEVKS